MFEPHLAHAAREKRGAQRGPDCAGVVGVMLNYRSVNRVTCALGYGSLLLSSPQMNLSSATGVALTNIAWCR